MAGDAEQIGQLITELGYPTTFEAMRDRLSTILADPSYATFVADTGGDVVGVAGAAFSWYYEKDGMYSRLLVLAVSSTKRGLGIGGELVQAVERWATAKGVREVVVNSGCTAATPIAFTNGADIPGPVSALSNSLELRDDREQKNRGTVHGRLQEKRP